MHLQEIQKHGPSAANFIVSKFQELRSNDSNETVTNTIDTPTSRSSNITCAADILPTGALVV